MPKLINDYYSPSRQQGRAVWKKNLWKNTESFWCPILPAPTDKNRSSVTAWVLRGVSWCAELPMTPWSYDGRNGHIQAARGGAIPSLARNLKNIHGKYTSRFSAPHKVTPNQKWGFNVQLMGKKQLVNSTEAFLFCLLRPSIGFETCSGHSLDSQWNYGNASDGAGSESNGWRFFNAEENLRKMSTLKRVHFKTNWWLNQPIWSILVKLEIFPK